jgi:hypothetical protein
MGSVAALTCSAPKIFLASETGVVLANDITSQLQCWVSTLEGVDSIGSMVVACHAKSAQFVVLGTAKCVVLDPLTGSVKVKVSHPSPATLKVASPQGVVAAVREYGSLHAWCLSSNRASAIWSGAAPLNSSL